MKKLISFKEFIAEQNDTITVEINSLLTTPQEKKKFETDAKRYGLTITYGKNSYANTIFVYGVKRKVYDFLKSKNYTDIEIKVVKTV